MSTEDKPVTAPATARFRLRVLGFPILATTSADAVAGLGPGKPLALLVYLTVRGEARRDELVDLLWGEVNETNGRNAFRQALHRLRNALGEDILPIDPDRVELAGQGLANDRAEFLRAVDHGDVATATRLYQSDFLNGFELGEPVFDSWVDAERTRLKARFQSALQSGAESALSAGRWLEALQYVQRLTTLAPYDEPAAILEANVLVAAGRTPEAVSSLRRFTGAMRDQLDLPPSPRIREMLARIERVESAREPAPAPSRPRDVAFVGRESELARLIGFARALSSEQGATVLISGTAGIGKSRLVTEFLARTKSLGPLLVLRGRERPVGTSLPYASLAEALRGALRAPGVAGTSRHLLAEASRILPDLRDTFELPEPGPVDAEGGRLRFFEGVAALLDSAAYEQPVCLVLDDMHNASGSTLDLIAYLAARLHTSPVLIVLIYRDDVAGSAALDKLLGDQSLASERSETESLALGPLEHRAVTELVESIIASREVARQIDVDNLALAAHGNPLRAIDLARRALNGEMPATAPVQLRDILWSRLQKASPSQRRVFFAAALLQRRCPLRLLAGAAHLPELATFEAAQELERLGLLSQEFDAYVVAHDFTSAFVAEASGMAGRALLAGWAADALAGERDHQSAELANLYSIAGEQTRAFVYARRAVYDAAALGSGVEVHRLLGLALALSPDGASRDEIESMLAAFGAGRRLIESTAPRGPAEKEGDTPRADEVDRADTVDAQPQRVVAEARIAEPAARVPKSTEPGRVRDRVLLTPRLAGMVVAGVIALAAAVSWSESRKPGNGPGILRDSLVVAERTVGTEGRLLSVTGALSEALSEALVTTRRDDAPQWVAALQLPWIRPSVSSSGLVAAERVGENGTDVYMLREGGDPVPVAVSPVTDAILGWSPDGRTLLVRRSRNLSDGSFDADLWAYTLGRDGPVATSPIDTSAVRSVEEEALWSPDGTRIAWVAQTGPAHQREIFLSRADGSGVVNLTDNPAEDYHIAWSSDGNLLAFTSDRDGNPDLFAFELDSESRRLWRLTRTPDEEDFASFSPDHRFVAYQSTVGGDAGVYVMPALGGTPTRVTPQGGQYSIVEWRGRPPAGHIDRFRIIGPSNVSLNDSVSISIFAADAQGNTRLPDSVSMTLETPDIADLTAVDRVKSAGRVFVLRGRRPGVARIVASIPGWRHDTLLVSVGMPPSSEISTIFLMGEGSDRWTPLGSPRPQTREVDGGVVLFPSGDAQWQSGILSNSVLSASGRLDLSVTFSAPFGRPVAGTTMTVALVSERASMDSVAPRFEQVAGIAWDGEASRFTYSVGPQSRSDPVSAIGPEETHRMRIAISAGDTVRFYVDDRLRWTSSLRFLGATNDRRVRLWLGGRATGDRASMRDLSISFR